VKIQVAVKTKSKVTQVSQLQKFSYSVRLKSIPSENVANKELIQILSEYFSIPKTSIKILRGLKSKHKLVEINEVEDSNKREKAI